MIDFSPVLPNLIVGSYPSSVVDARRLVQAGISAVMNLQSDRDFVRLGIDWPALETTYHDLGLAPYRIPMVDFDEADIARLLPQAVHSLDRALDSGHRVYLHCTAGQERAPTTAVAWLAWYGGHSLDDALALMRAARHPVNPYEDMLRRLPPPEMAPDRA
jgi:atypical dual specificity phosphatase